MTGGGLGVFVIINSVGEIFVTVPGKNDQFVIISDSRYWYHVVARYSLYATVKSESR